MRGRGKKDDEVESEEERNMVKRGEGEGRLMRRRNRIA